MGAEEHVTQRAEARLGRTLRGKWRLDALVGVGGMAAVYAATHRNGKRAAVKVLHPDVAENADLKMRFLREGYVANAVEHPGAVSVFDDDTDDDGSVYLVMELLEGETLEGRWERKQRRLDPGEVLSVTDKLLDVLAAAHSRGIVHRDIKPENVFLTRDGAVKVLDFGIARLVEMAGQQTRTLATRAGSTMGTPAFMAPEQASGEWDKVDGQSDLWTVGAVMFTCISGRYVHEGRNLNEQLVASATRRAPSLARVAPHVDAVVAAFVDRALAFDKRDRWADAATMQLALREAYWAREGVARGGGAEPPPVDRAISVHMAASAVAKLEEAALDGDQDPTRTMTAGDVDDGSPTTTAIDVFDKTVPVTASEVQRGLARAPRVGGGAAASSASPSAAPEGAHGSRTPSASGPLRVPSGAAKVPSGAAKVPSGAVKVPSGKTPSGSGPHARPSSARLAGRPVAPHADDEEVDAPAVFKLERSGPQEVLAVKQVGAMGTGGGPRAPESIDGLARTGAGGGARARRRAALLVGIGAAAMAVLGLLSTLLGRPTGTLPSASGASAGASAPPVGPASASPVGPDAGGHLDPHSPPMAR